MTCMLVTGISDRLVVWVLRRPVCKHNIHVTYHLGGMGSRHIPSFKQIKESRSLTKYLT